MQIFKILSPFTRNLLLPWNFVSLCVLWLNQCPTIPSLEVKGGWVPKYPRHMLGALPARNYVVHTTVAKGGPHHFTDKETEVVAQVIKASIFQSQGTNSHLPDP